MVAVQVAFPVKLGLMRVILKLLESVDGELGVQHPARELVCKYLTEEHARSLVAAAAAGSDPAQTAHLLPVAFQLVAVAIRIRTMGGGQQNDKANKRAAAGGDLLSLVSEVFCPAWSSDSASSANGEQVRAALAKSLVNIFQNVAQSVSVVPAVVSFL